MHLPSAGEFHNYMPALLGCLLLKKVNAGYGYQSPRTRTLPLRQHNNCLSVVNKLALPHFFTIWFRGSKRIGTIQIFYHSNFPHFSCFPKHGVFSSVSGWLLQLQCCLLWPGLEHLQTWKPCQKIQHHWGSTWRQRLRGLWFVLSTDINKNHKPSPVRNWKTSVGFKASNSPFWCQI